MTAEQILRQEAEWMARFAQGRPMFRQWLLENGQAFTKLIPEGSIAPMRRIKECYSNSIQALMDGTLDPDEWTYCEGVMLRPGLPVLFEHGWLVNQAGEVLDLTLRDQVGATYFGIPYDFTWLESYIQEWGYYGLHMNDCGYNPDVFNGRLLEGKATLAKEIAA